MNISSQVSITVSSLTRPDEIAVCARMMATSEPWITLGRDYEAGIKTLTAPGKEIYLARIENDIVGFTILNMRGAFIGYIQTLCIAPEWRSRGIGSQLIAFAEERIFRESPNVFMCVSSFNHNAQRLYQRLGYEVIGELKDYLVTGHSEILLRKMIASLSDFAKNPHPAEHP
ncbi:MAG: GNAT family N-acetyltransferase [Anaerolineae bacterium]|nr:GNAT family N-acetyltransferase [Anaerolineae bacterium]